MQAGDQKILNRYIDVFFISTKTKKQRQHQTTLPLILTANE